ncbi:heme peroxidase [Corynascus similis CBS 632.67]
MARTQHREKANGAVKVRSISSGSTASVDTGEKLASQAKPKPVALKLKPTKANKQGVANAFEHYGQVIQAKVQPLPNQNQLGMGTAPKRWGKLKDDLKTLRSADWKALKTVVLSKLKGEKWTDDKTMIMERVIQLVSNLPSDSKLRVELTNTFLGELWYSLEHPPSRYLGDKYKYRQADGSYNNIMFPQLGAAGTTYARSVNANVLRPGALPDPNLIYDSVMKRTEYKKHPNNVSSILWYWASIIIHDLFWTDHEDMNRSKTSSYLDLSPLYGSNQEMQDTIRTFKDGKLKPDAFADKRLLGLPPGVGVLLIMFNRVHNYVCDNLIAINEDGKFTPPSPKLEGEKAAAAWKKYDEELFQTARLITSGLYINITLLDYVRNIVNDDKWIEEFYHELFGKPGSEMTVQDLIVGFGKFAGRIPEDPLERPFNKFQRGPDGKYSDDDLVECITSAIEDCAGSFGARNVPASMRAIEILGIIQGRKWNVAGLNEFRKHFGLKAYESFEDINSDPGVADALRRLYDHPDFVELYPGLVAEEHKEPMVPGVGIAPTYTISRVVLSDAVCLVRGDRHYTVDYTPRNLTNWGFNDVQYDLNINHGCVFYKLFIRAFPHHFKHDSVYAHYPMVVPSETEKILKDLKRDHLFDFSRPTRIAKETECDSVEGAQQVFANPEKYKASWHAGIDALAPKGKSKLSADAATHDRHRSEVSQPLATADFISQVKEFYRKVTEQLLDGQSYHLGGLKMADLVRDIGNIAPTHFVSSLFNLPLQTKENPKGIYTEHELYAVLSVIAEAVFTNPDPVKKFPLVEAAKTVAAQLASAVERTVKSPKAKKDSLSAYGAQLIKGLSKAGLNNHDITWGHVLASSAAIAPYQAKLFAEAVDFYLSPKGAPYLERIRGLAAQTPSEQTDAELLGYALEGIRLSGSTRLHFEATAADSLPAADGTKIQVQPGDRIAVSSPATSDGEVDTSRSRESYVHLAGLPSSSFLGTRKIGDVALTEMFRALFKRPNVRRAPGPQGELKRVVGANGASAGAVEYLREDWGSKGAWPVTMKVCWDENA